MRGRTCRSGTGTRSGFAATGGSAGLKRSLRSRRNEGGSVLAEVELLRGLLIERVAQELLVAVRAQVVAELFERRGQVGGRGGALPRLGEHLADLFHMVGVEVGVGQLG